ncbi:MAG: dihydroorotate dehydrogenase electron transfer subunit [Oscillospiraceae bacterium]|jgi:dihydroorotate dehydrogenase electron transfer subunit|nr:dihydroorotate dehydrogenase electron transfer subunit [Oscillospiraceae bacterium]
MKKQIIYKIKSNRCLAKDVFLLTLVGDVDFAPQPGQFVNIKIEDFFLRRPISICSCTNSSLNLIYKVIGNGTKKLSQMLPNQELNLLCGLGHGFDLKPAIGKIVLVGGGVGAAPLFFLAEKLKEAGANFIAVLGWQNANSIFYLREFSSLCPVFVATNTGEAGQKGFVTDILKTMAYDYYFACGPLTMLKAIHKCGKPGQLSLEERMGCGFGICLACCCNSTKGNKLVCTRGPVFFSNELIFD